MDAAMKTRFPTYIDFEKGHGASGIELEWQWVTSNQEVTSKCGTTLHVSQEDSRRKVSPLTLEPPPALEFSAKHEKRLEIMNKDDDDKRIDSFLKSCLIKRNLAVYGAVETQFGSSEIEDPQEDHGNWLTADEKKLTDLITTQTKMSLENCDLPTSLNCLPASVESCSTLNDDSKVNTREDPNLCKRKHVSSSPRNIPHQQAQHNSAFQQAKSLGSNRNTEDGTRSSSEILYEALCHSQTRARESDKLAAQAQLEYEHLLHLFVREACLSFTYKHWVMLLEMESLLLKKQQLPQGGLTWKDHKHHSAFMHSSADRARDLQTQLQQQWHHSRSDITDCTSDTAPEGYDSIVGCALGLGLAVGFSLASFSLAVGLNMGWIRFRA